MSRNFDLFKQFFFHCCKFEMCSSSKKIIQCFALDKIEFQQKQKRKTAIKILSMAGIFMQNIRMQWSKNGNWRIPQMIIIQFISFFFESSAPFFLRITHHISLSILYGIWMQNQNQTKILPTNNLHLKKRISFNVK